MKAPLEEILARRLREVAEARGMPISHVADRCGLAHSYFWRVLEAKASPSLAVVQRLADALEVDPLVLLQADGGEAPRAPVAPRRAKPPAKVARGARGAKRDGR